MEFWHNRWDKQQIGWHKTVFNELLVKHWSSIKANPGCEVIVPLCGKSLDMLWLANQGHTVVGLEMVDQAVKAFFSDNKLAYSSTKTNAHTKYSSGPFTILQGDIFALESGTIQADAWYDRAAMIAIEPSTRDAYVDQIRTQTKPGAVGLLITFAYPQEQMIGPPFALHDEHVLKLFSKGFEIECLESLNLDDDKDRGLSNVKSSVFKITRI